MLLAVCIFSPKRAGLQIYGLSDNIVTKAPSAGSCSILAFARLHAFQLLHGMGSAEVIRIGLEYSNNSDKGMQELRMFLCEFSEDAVEVRGCFDGEVLRHALEW